jgi:uncharacterized protein (DUF1501 family)
MPLSRRAMLKRSALAAASALLPLPGLRNLAFAANSTGNILVVLHLRGGCDGLNLLSPAGDSDFIEARNSDLRVAAEGSDAGHLIRHAQAGAPEFRLHAAAGALAELADAKHLAFIHAAGLMDTTRSHFAATDMIEHGVAGAAALNRTPTGWMGRAMANGSLHQDAQIRAVSTSGNPSGAWSGDAAMISVGDLSNGLGAPGGVQSNKVLEQLYSNANSAADDAVCAAGRLTLQSMTAIDARLPRDAHGKYLAYVPEPSVNYDAAYELGRPLKALAQLIKMDMGLQAATVDLGGWDTHEYQPGRFKNQVDRLSQGLGAFYNDLARYQDRLTVVVLTEFGRRLRANRSNGTDHGRGSVLMVLGGRVAGGQILGRWPGLKSEELEEGVDLAVANDYRQVLSNVIGHWNPGSKISEIFPEYKASADLALFT